MCHYPSGKVSPDNLEDCQHLVDGIKVKIYFVSPVVLGMRLHIMHLATWARFKERRSVSSYLSQLELRKLQPREEVSQSSSFGCQGISDSRRGNQGINCASSFYKRPWRPQGFHTCWNDETTDSRRRPRCTGNIQQPPK